jgi:hypothetical protein
MPGTPLGNTCVLSISAGAAVAAALEDCSPPAGATGAFTVGSPNLSGGGAGRPAPWVPSSRLAHHQRMAAAGSSDGGGSAAVRSATPDSDDNWRSGGGNRPPRGPRTSIPSSGGGSSSGGGRQRRKSWHATEAEEAAIAAGASLAAAEAVAAAADGSTSDSSIRKSGRQGSRLGQAGDYQATIEAIREASCELDSGAVGRAIAALSISGRKKGSSSSGGGGGADGVITPEGDAAGDGEHGKRRRARHRRSRSSGSRRQSLDDARPHVFSELPASGGVGAVGLSPRAAIRHGPLAPDEAHHRHDKHSSSGGGSGGEHHHGHSSHGGARGSGAGAHDSSSGGKKKKDYAAWAAATPEFRAVATAAKHISGSGSGGSAAVLSTSPARSTGMMSPMRGQAAGVAAQAPGSSLSGHAHHQEHTARGPDGSRGFAMGRGRPITAPAP